MKFRDWLKWMRSKPLYLRWFILFMLVRPIAEQFYNLKEISPLLSPLYWLGFLTLVFSLIGIMKGRRQVTNVDRVFSLWGGLVTLSIAMIFLSSDNLFSYFNYAIKLILPLVLFFFLRVFLKSKEDLVGLATTFIISCIFPVIFMLVGLSGGKNVDQDRYSGSYADVFSIAFYLSIGLIALLYLFINSRTYEGTLRIRNSYVLIGLLMALTGLWIIKHLATVVVISTTLSLFVFIVFKKHRGAAIFLFIITLVVTLSSGDKFYDEVLDPRLEKEFEVLEGSRGLSQGMHGRMSRWNWLLGEFNSAPFYSQIAGYPLSLKISNHMVGITPHNDFLRMLFFTGYAGLILYLLILYRVFSRIRYKDLPDRFFLYAVLAATILYSITTVPTFYPGYVNVLSIVFAYCALPVKLKHAVTRYKDSYTW
jgi:hypothetical protein